MFCEEPAIQETWPQDYVQQSAQPEASVQVPTFPTPVQAALMVRNRSRRRAMDPSLEEFRAFRQFAAAISAIYGGNFDQPDEEEVQFCSSRVKDFVKTLARVEISTLGADDLKCSICKLEYGKRRGNIAEPASDSDQELLGEGTPEDPVKLWCGPEFGDCWLHQDMASRTACFLPNM